MITRNNFILIFELSLAVLIIIATVLISTQKFSNILKKSENIATKKGLASLRNAIALCYSDNDGIFPGIDIAKELVEQGYIASIPFACIPRHKKSNIIYMDDFTNNVDAGGWVYKVDVSNNSSNKHQGQICINCTCDDLGKL